MFPKSAAPDGSLILQQRRCAAPRVHAAARPDSEG